MTESRIIRHLMELDGVMDFQKVTALHLFRILISPDYPHHRALLADEVGLGKTIVAKTVVSLVREYLREEAPKVFFRVVYVCSNINIASQNISRLGIKEIMPVGESRLSMQHLTIAQRNSQIRKAYEQGGQFPEIIIPLTPATSFNLRSNPGIADERALICVFLEELDEFKDDQSKEYIEKLFKCNVFYWENWLPKIDHYRAEVSSLGPEYRDEVIRGIRKYGSDVIAKLKVACCVGAPLDTALVASFRRVFAEISLDELKPNLVIMDEFQRFRDLISSDESEQGLLSRKFFSNPDTKVLLLSATPYKPFTTLDELTESGSDEHFSDFLQLMEFLHKGNESQKQIFDQAWRRFNLSLKHISSDTFEGVRISKEGAEDALYRVMARTERFNIRGVRTDEASLTVSHQDICSYLQARKLLGEVDRVAPRGGYRTLPTDYVKSSPYLMSFMDRYRLKDYVRDNRGHLGRETWDLLYLPLEKVDGYKDVPLSNARLQYLYDALFEKYDAERLLWVPASRPYYRTRGVYSRNAGFSKILLFSSWAMVPRMVSCMLSYSSERLVTKGLRRMKKRPGRYFRVDDQKSRYRYGANRLSKLKEGENPLCYVSKRLAEVYVPAHHLGWDINEIKTALTPVVSGLVKEVVEKYGIPVSKKSSAADLTSLMRLIDGEQLEMLPDGIREDTVENLVSIAIASPAICAYRLHQDMALAKRIARFFDSMFDRPDSAMVIDLVSGKGADNYIEAILEYCVEGNLQAVLDEYDHLLEGNWESILNQGSMGVVNFNVEMQNPDGSFITRSMRAHLAIPFTDARMDMKVVARTSNIRNAFNSPFRPFVLSTTSVGQEGLDFHWYARKVLHWNLPSNPVDLEQREGRVNRYKCLSIRQRLGRKYADLSCWDAIFEAAASDYKRDDSDLVPFWCLPPDFDDDSEHLVERIILEYPLSLDQGKYHRLSKILALYRLTMGQPRQEELLEMLAESGLSEDRINELLINLSPFYRGERLDGENDN